MPYYNTQWHKITYINTKYLTKKKPFFKAFKHFFLYSTVKLPKKEMCAILHSWETIEPKAALLLLYFSEGSSSSPDERKEGDAMITYPPLLPIVTAGCL